MTTRPRILIVEDDASLREVLVTTLVPFGFDTVGVADGQEALEAIARDPFDAIICDVRLPGMNGIQTLREARKYRPHIRGVVITGYASETAPIEAIQIGVDGYFRKPFDLTELVRLLREKLEGVRQTQDEERRRDVREARWCRLLGACAAALGPGAARQVLSAVVEGDPDGEKLVALLLAEDLPGKTVAPRPPYEAERTCRTYLELGLAYSEAGEEERAIEALERALPLLPTLVDHELSGEILYLLGRLSLWEGELERAKRFAEELDRRPSGGSRLLSLRLALLRLHLDLETGNAGIRERLQGLLALSRELGLPEEEVELCCLAASCALEDGDQEAARRLLEQGAELFARFGLWPLFVRLLPRLLPLLLQVSTGPDLSDALRTVLAKVAAVDPGKLAALLDHQDETVLKQAGRFLAVVQKSTDTTLQVFTFGTLRVFHNGRCRSDREFRRRKVKYLLAYLLWHWPRGVPEETILATMWPDLPLVKARQALYNHVYLLRHLLEPGLSDGRKSRYVVVEQDNYRFVADPPTWCDLFLFREQIDQGRRLVSSGYGQEAVWPLSQAVRLYAGPYVSECLEEWCLEHRAMLEGEYLWGMKFLAEHWEGVGAWERAAEQARRLLLVDPAAEEEHRRLMRCYLHLSRPDKARQQFDLCRERLKHDIGCDPSTDTVAIYLEAGGRL